MTVELTLLAWSLVLALVQVLLPAAGRTRQLGLKWNAGARDETPPPPTPTTARLTRAQANLYETLPLFAVAVLIAVVGSRTSAATAVGAHLYFWGRVAYLPLYAFGVPYVRSLAWGVSLTGLGMILIAILLPA